MKEEIVEKQNEEKEEGNDQSREGCKQHIVEGNRNTF